MESFRVNQRVCRVKWKNGVPGIKVGIVTKVSSQAYYVDGAKTRSTGWHALSGLAIEAEFLELFRDWDIFLGDRRGKDWTVGHTVQCVIQLHRLVIKLQKSRRKQKSLQARQ